MLFSSGLGSSDDENSDKPLITHQSAERDITHAQGGNTHASQMRRSYSYLRENADQRQLVSLSADDGSDWSTLTAESGEDTPSWPLAMDTEECEVVRCVCEVDEENDFMIQVRRTNTH